MNTPENSRIRTEVLFTDNDFNISQSTDVRNKVMTTK